MCNNNQPIEVIEYKGHKINIEIDKDSHWRNPRKEWDNLCTFALKDWSHLKGDEDEEIKYKTDYIQELLEELEIVKYDDNGDFTGYWETFFYNLDADHEETINKALELIGHFYLIREYKGRNFNGYILVSKDKVKKEYKVKRISPKLRETIFSVMDAEEQTFEHWGEGEVYGYSCENPDGEDYGGCWGFFGYEWEKNGLLDHAKSEIDCEIRERREKRQEKLKTLIKNNVPLWKREEILIHI